MNKDFSKKIIESAKKSEENKKYIKEDFGVGLFKTGIQFKKYQDNFVNNFVSCLDTVYDGKLLPELKTKIKKNELVKLSFSEDIQNSNVKIYYDLETNEINQDMGRIEVIISVNNDAYQFNITNNLKPELLSASEIDQLINNFNGISFVFENFELLIDAINEFSRSLLYAYVNYLNKVSGGVSESFNNEAIEGFLKYLEEEVKREIFINPVINKYVDLMIDKESNIISVRMRTFDRKSYLVVNWIYAPEIQKFKQISNVSNVKNNRLKSITQLNVENVLSFIQAIKDDITTILGKAINEKRRNIAEKIEFELKLENFRHKQYLDKITHESKYLDTLEYLPEGVDYDHRANSYIILKHGGYLPEGVIIYPKELDRDWDDEEEESTSTPAGMPATPQDMGTVKPITNAVEPEMEDEIVDDIPASTEVINDVIAPEGQVTDNVPEMDEYDKGIEPEEVDLKDNVNDMVIPGEMEVVYNVSDPESVMNLVGDIAGIGEDAVINKLIDMYNAESTNIVTTTDYMNDFGVVSEDKIYSKDGYTLIYNPQTNKVVLLKDLDQNRFNIGITEKRRIKEGKKLKIESRFIKLKKIQIEEKKSINEEVDDGLIDLGITSKDNYGVWRYYIDKDNKQLIAKSSGGLTDIRNIIDIIPDFETFYNGEVDSDVIDAIKDNLNYNPMEDIEGLESKNINEETDDIVDTDTDETPEEEEVENEFVENKELYYISKSAEEAQELIDILNTPTEDDVDTFDTLIETIDQKKEEEAENDGNTEEEPEEETYDLTDNFLDDFEVDLDADTIIERDGFIIIYNSPEDLEDLNFIVLKDLLWDTELTDEENIENEKEECKKMPEEMKSVYEKESKVRAKARIEGRKLKLRKKINEENDDMLHYGFSIGTTSEDIIEEKAKEDGINLTPKIWEMLNKDISQIELNVINELKKTPGCITINDEGHGDNDLIGSIYVKPNSQISESIDYLFEYGEPYRTDSGTMPLSEEEIYKNTSKYSYLIGVTLDFFKSNYDNESKKRTNENVSRLVKNITESIRRNDILIPYGRNFEMISNGTFESIKKESRGKIISNITDKETGNKYRVGIFEGSDKIVYSKIINEEDMKNKVINYYKTLSSNSPDVSDDVLDKKIADYFKISLKKVKEYLG